MHSSKGLGGALNVVIPLWGWTAWKHYKEKIHDLDMLVYLIILHSEVGPLPAWSASSPFSFSDLERVVGSGTGIELIRVFSSKSAARVTFSYKQL